MALPKHFEAETFWEKRCAHLEMCVLNLMNILSDIGLPPEAAYSVRDLASTWDRNLTDMRIEHESSAGATPANSN